MRDVLRGRHDQLLDRRYLLKPARRGGARLMAATGRGIQVVDHDRHEAAAHRTQHACADRQPDGGELGRDGEPHLATRDRNHLRWASRARGIREINDLIAAEQMLLADSQALDIGRIVCVSRHRHRLEDLCGRRHVQPALPRKLAVPVQLENAVARLLTDAGKPAGLAHELRDGTRHGPGQGRADQLEITATRRAAPRPAPVTLVYGFAHDSLDISPRRVMARR